MNTPIFDSLLCKLKEVGMNAPKDSLIIRHLGTASDSVNANIFWFDFNGKVYGIREHNGSQAVVDINEFPIETKLQPYFLPLFTVTSEMRRVA